MACRVEMIFLLDGEDVEGAGDDEGKLLGLHGLLGPG